MKLTDYRSLGRSGLVISPFALGAMTFGTEHWGSNDAASRAIFEAYLEAGGNFVDTADVYSGGRSETMLGRFIRESNSRDRVVIATKAGFGTSDHPHSGGSGSKHLHSALEGSLRRLGVEHVDLYWLHVWDMVTPAEELLQTMTALVRSGKIRYWGVSNAPAWYVAQIATLARAYSLPGPIALQYEYSLVERGVEAEIAPVAKEFGLGLQPWSPLGGGFLTGKYRREDPDNVAGRRAPTLPDGAPVPHTEKDGRLSGANPFGDSKFSDRNWSVLEAVRSVASEAGASPAEVSLAWLLARPCVSSVLIGASRPEQLAANLAALELELSSEQQQRLEKASSPSVAYPSTLLSPFVRRLAFGGNEVQAWR